MNVREQPFREEFLLFACHSDVRIFVAADDLMHAFGQQMAVAFVEHQKDVRHRLNVHSRQFACDRLKQRNRWNETSSSLRLLRACMLEAGSCCQADCSPEVQILPSQSSLTEFSSVCILLPKQV